MTDKKFDNRFRLSYLNPLYLPAWLGIGLLGLLAYVPVRWRDALADVVSGPLSYLPVSLRRKVFDNFACAFPDMDRAGWMRLYREHLRVGLKVILGYGETFFRDGDYIRASFKVSGRAHFEAALQLGKPIIFLGSHSWAVDHCGVFLSASGLRMSTMMHTSKNPVYDWFMNSMRLKFGGKVYERGSGIRPIVRSLREGYHAAFYPDEDLGRQGALFVPFFAGTKATLSVLPRIAALGRAAVVPFFAAYNEKEHKYEVVFDAPFENYPSGDLTADVRLMNAAIEKGLAGREGQYMWFLHFYRTKEHEDEESAEESTDGADAGGRQG